MTSRKRNKPRVWRVWVGFVNDHPHHDVGREPWPVPMIGASLSRRNLRRFYDDVRLCEIREVPKRRKARRRK